MDFLERLERQYDPAYPQWDANRPSRAFVMRDRLLVGLSLAPLPFELGHRTNADARVLPFGQVEKRI